eukprot:7449785-Pyramimonas_sp.AAC.1
MLDLGILATHAALEGFRYARDDARARGGCHTCCTGFWGLEIADCVMKGRARARMRGGADASDMNSHVKNGR